MRSVAVGVRLLRRRKGWRQADLARLALVSQPTVSRIERGELERVTIGALSRCVRQLDARLLIDLRVHGESIADLADATHAALQNWVAGYLGDAGWQVRPEVSFNHYGDRGRIDVLAAHAPSGVIAVVEVKSAIHDVQDTLGRLDVKLRVARGAARELGWRASAAVPVLIVADHRTSQRRVADHRSLFERFSMRGRSGLAWLRRPRGQPPPGILAFVRVPDIHGSRKASRRQPVRVPTARDP
jgi:predicted XRE-type DNA-binding protein